MKMKNQYELFPKLGRKERKQQIQRLQAYQNSLHYITRNKKKQ